MSKLSKKVSPQIASNKKIYHDYHIEQRFEAGISLLGWEVKSIRAGKVQLKDSYVIFKQKEPWLIGSHISPLHTTSTHEAADPQRSRKLLLHLEEIQKLQKAVQQKGYTLVPLDFHWHNNRVKLTIALSKGKKTHDKRASIKQKEWDREKARLIKRKR